MTAYYILSETDVYGLYQYVETKLQTAQAKLQQVQAASGQADKLKTHVQALQKIHDVYRAKLPFLGDTNRIALLRAACEAEAILAKRCRLSPKGEEQPESALYRRLLTARAAEKRNHAEKVQATDPALAEGLRVSAAAHEDEPAAAVCRHVDRDSAAASSNGNAASDYRTTMYERELFGEMACRNRKPRAADVRAVRPCYVLEMLSNVLDILDEDPRFKKELQDTYTPRGPE